MNMVLKFDNENGQSHIVTFNEESQTLFSADGRSGRFVRDGGGADLKVGGQSGRIDVMSELKAGRLSATKKH